MWTKCVGNVFRGSSVLLTRAHIKNIGYGVMNRTGACSILGCEAYLAGVMPVRCKYVQNKGVKGIRNRKNVYEALAKADEDDEHDAIESSDTLNLDDRAYDELASDAMNVTRTAEAAQNVLIIQPYVKWGTRRNTLTTPDDQLQEAEALIGSLPNWKIAFSMKVPLESLDRRTLFGSGKIDELKTLVQEQQLTQPLTCLFVSKGTLSFAQKRFLEATFKLPIMDRYSVVIQILRLHATSAEARLQVAMAEIPYIWAQTKEANPSQARKQGYSLTDTQREILKTRERKLKQELERIRGHRKLLRNKRKQKNYPVIAVVGYTNAGKTSLIKALTQEQSMQPRNQLFATLDVTAHAGMLPCNLEVIYMDTVGFMSDLPTGLIECFVATLEDAMLADVIIHVQDLAHSCKEAQRQHVETTLKSLSQNVSNREDECEKNGLPPIINVGNKLDLVATPNSDAAEASNMHLVSAKEQTGLQQLLRDIERQILAATGRRKLTMRVSNGGEETAWLHKNAAVTDMRADTKSAEHLLISVVISETAMQRFKRTFCQ